jgi:hypothetical protein
MFFTEVKKERNPFGYVLNVGDQPLAQEVQKQVTAYGKHLRVMFTNKSMLSIKDFLKQ